jgi:hypothetical protein
MFRIADEPTFVHEVKVRVPADGGHIDETLRATFRVVPVDRMAVFDLYTREGTDEFLAAAVVRLDDLVDDGGEQLPWSDAIRERVLALPYVRAALTNAYVEAVTGARLGNSDGLPAGGRAAARAETTTPSRRR